MKISCLKVGGRTIKTAVAVFLCLLTGIVRKSDTAFYAAIAAVLCVQRTSKDSFREALNREVATVIGGMWGMLVLLFEKNVWCIPYEVLRYLFLSVLLIPIINFSVLIKREKGTFLMCVVFLCITVTHGNDVSPLSFGIARILDTTIGIVIALIINQFPIRRKEIKESGYRATSAIMEYFDNSQAACEAYWQSTENLKSYMQRQWSLVGGMAGMFREME